MALNYWIIWIVCFWVFKQSGKTLAIDDFTCENNVINLHCPEGEVVMMQTAYYNGTAGDENCTNSKTLKPDCGKDVLNIMAKSCDDLNQCQVLANNARFKDSCPGTYKILKVRYECVPLNKFCPSKNCSNCDNHGVGHLVLANVGRSLFITDNFSRVFCHGSEKPIRSDISVNNTMPRGKKRKWPELENGNGIFVLRLRRWHTKRGLNIYVVRGENCSELVNQTKGECKPPVSDTGTCNITCLKTDQVCNNAGYNEGACRGRKSNNKYFVDVTTSKPTCTNCNNPVKQSEVKQNLNKTISNQSSVPASPDQLLDAETAKEVMRSMTPDFVDQFNESSVGLTLGMSVTGVLVKQTDPEDLEEVSLGFTKGTNFNILEDRNALSQFSRSVTVPKHAFDKALSMNISKPFVAVFLFLNMSKDENNSTVLADEVVAIEMGTIIKNLTDTININFRNMDYKGIPSCHSWNGNGVGPCGPVMATPLNETISADDLNTLTIITRVGCGLSMFFLGIVLFMHFVMRRASSSDSIKILIHLVFAMFLLDFAFLVNDLVAKTKNVIGCKVMAAVMHYFMLSTFTWFAVHAFHLCLQLYSGGKIKIRRYVLKVSIISWVMPSVIGIVLLSIGKYGEVVISTGNAATSVAMCWILDNEVHYIVNIGYYALVFVFTFSTFVLMLTWLFHMSRKQKGAAPGKHVSSCQRIVTIMGLCCILGVTWGCAFFAYGVFRVPAYYCFTVLNSFQGFCLFIYYYKTSRTVETKDPHSSSGSISTLKTNLDEILNPYDNSSSKPKPE